MGNQWSNAGRVIVQIANSPAVPLYKKNESFSISWILEAKQGILDTSSPSFLNVSTLFEGMSDSTKGE